MTLAEDIQPVSAGERHPRYGTNTGHGHVWARPDGVRARCGGPQICSECAHDLAIMIALPTAAGLNSPAPAQVREVGRHELSRLIADAFDMYGKSPMTIADAIIQHFGKLMTEKAP